MVPHYLIGTFPIQFWFGNCWLLNKTKIGFTITQTHCPCCVPGVGVASARYGDEARSWSSVDGACGAHPRPLEIATLPPVQTRLSLDRVNNCLSHTSARARTHPISPELSREEQMSLPGRPLIPKSGQVFWSSRHLPGTCPLSRSTPWVELGIWPGPACLTKTPELIRNRRLPRHDCCVHMVSCYSPRISLIDISLWNFLSKIDLQTPTGFHTIWSDSEELFRGFYMLTTVENWYSKMASKIALNQVIYLEYWSEARRQI